MKRASAFTAAVWFGFVLSFQLGTLCFARGPWVTLQGGHLLVKRANDGDSFHVSIEGKEYIFRLYFIDTPETSAEFRDRVEEQAEYFGITPEQAVAVGEVAKNFTREKLSAPFAVRTCWENAMGRSRLQRFYALVQTSTGDLGEELIENGLARLEGLQADPEGLTAARREWQKLNQLQQKAKRELVGGWGVNVGRMMTRATPEQSGKPPDSKSPASTGTGGAANASSSSAPSIDASVGPGSNKLDVNTASEAELENVPGIGPVMAQRIIEARPFKSADDLRHVKGIGDKKYEVLRPYFQ